jgi:hypothetical protein
MNGETVDRDPATRARGAIEIVCSGDISQMADYYSGEFIDHVNDGVHIGHEGLMSSFALYQSVFNGGWRFEVVDQVTERNRVASRWILRGSCWRRPVALIGATISTVDEDGCVREDFGYTDTLSLVKQLGVLRSLRLGAEVLVGRVKLPKAAG